MMSAMEIEESESLQLFEVRVGGVKVQSAGVSDSGVVYINGDIHPSGSLLAMAAAQRADVPFVSVSAVEVLFPAEWLRGECLHDPDRLRIIDNAMLFVRGAS